MQYNFHDAKLKKKYNMNCLNNDIVWSGNQWLSDTDIWLTWGPSRCDTVSSDKMWDEILGGRSAWRPWIRDRRSIAGRVRRDLVTATGSAVFLLLLPRQGSWAPDSHRTHCTFWPWTAAAASHHCKPENTHMPTFTRLCPTAGLMLGQRLWPNIKPALGQSVVFAWFFLFVSDINF